MLDNADVFSWGGDDGYYSRKIPASVFGEEVFVTKLRAGAGFSVVLTGTSHPLLTSLS